MGAIKILLAGAVLFLLFPLSAHALIEVKVGYGFTATNPSNLNSWAGNGGPQIGTQTGLTGDVMVKLPLVPIGFGLRYEDMGQTTGNSSSSGGQAVTDVTREAILVNYRLIDFITYLGPIATLGIANGVKYNLTQSNVTSNYTTNSGSFNGSVGFEGGVHLGLVLVGGELGYLYAPMGNLVAPGGGNATYNGSNVSVDYSGFYAHLLVGIGF